LTQAFYTNLPIFTNVFFGLTGKVWIINIPASTAAHY